MSARRSARNLRTADLLANPANIREDLGPIAELARSIQQQGILNPLLVTEDPMHRGWLLLAGHRRLAASREAGLLAVPCFIHHDVGTDQVEQTVVMLIENVHRRSLSPVEKARAYGRLRDTGLTPTQIARRTGFHVSSVHTHLALLDLDEESLAAVDDGELTAGDAIAAVRRARQEKRAKAGQALRGAPVQLEPRHFTEHHPQAAIAGLMCQHANRLKVVKGACDQCFEEAIRQDERDRIEAAAQEAVS